MNYIASHPAFNDTIDSLKNEFKDDKSNNVIICGAHGFVQEDNDSEVKYIQAATLDEWKSKVIGSLPNGASIKMRMDIEEFLDGIKNVY